MRAASAAIECRDESIAAEDASTDPSTDPSTIPTATPGAASPGMGFTVTNARNPSPAVAVALLGTGGVGGALLQLLNTPAAASLHLVAAANSRRQQTDPAQLAQGGLREHLNHHGEVRDDASLLRALGASPAKIKVVIDATASATLAMRHVEWLACGYHVVTANKALSGGALCGWHALQLALKQGGRYGDSATVGAGLPVLSTLRRLRSCGDQLLTVEGVFSGSLSWLFNRHDGSRRFSVLLREARRLGYTEPDPRADLSGKDAARKLLIIARNAGFSLGTDEVQVENLVPESLRALGTKSFLAQLEALDAPMAARLAEAKSRGCVLRYLGRLNQRGLARVGLVEVPPHHPAARLYGTDNQFAFTTARYHAQPLVIQGPGAGPEITAQALLGDVLALL